MTGERADDGEGDMPGRLVLTRCGGTIDLPPSAGLEDLTVHLGRGTTVRGAGLFPSERISGHTV